MDILHLVDRLEELFNESRPIPFTNNVIVDEDRMLDIIDQMRVAIPDQVKQAEKLLAERDRTLAQAQEEASRTVQLAREKSEGLLERDSIVEAAQTRGEQIIEQAQRDAKQREAHAQRMQYDGQAGQDDQAAPEERARKESHLHCLLRFGIVDVIMSLVDAEIRSGR